MEWVDLQAAGGYSPLEESLYGFFSSPQQHNHHHQRPEVAAARATPVAEWTFEENKLFEDALAEFDISSPDFFENVTSRVPWKTVEDIKKHYQALVEDVELIESGQFPMPDYEDDYYEVKQEDDHVMTENQSQHQNGAGGSSMHEAAKPKNNNGQPRRRGVPWTEEEHQLFLMGLNKYGKGDWRSISRYYVITKTPTQVASHAQKYFRRQTSSTPVERRRPSIHDIQTVNPIPTAGAIIPAVAAAAAPPSRIAANTHCSTGGGLMATSNNPHVVLDGTSAAIPNMAASNSAGGQIMIPMLNPNYLHAAIDHQNPMFQPLPSASSTSDPTIAYMNQFQNAPAVASYMFPSFGNSQQPWCSI